MSEASKAKTKAKPVAAQGKEAYVELLNEMRVHTKRRTSGEATGLLMASPHLQHIHLRSLYVTKRSDDPAVRNLEPKARETGEAQADQSESELVKATEQFQNSGSTNTTDYRKKLEELRKRDKESADKRIDKMYDAALEQLDQFPDSADAVVGFMETFGGLFNTVLDKITEFFTEIGKKILNWLKNVWEKITDTFRSIVRWISGWFSKG